MGSSSRSNQVQVQIKFKFKSSSGSNQVQAQIKTKFVSQVNVNVNINYSRSHKFIIHTFNSLKLQIITRYLSFDLFKIHKNDTDVDIQNGCNRNLGIDNSVSTRCAVSDSLDSVKNIG